MRNAAFLALLLLPLSGCAADDASAGDLLPAAPTAPLGPWNFTASRVLLLDGLGACKLLTFPVPEGALSLDLFVSDPLLLTAHGLNNIDGAGRVRIEAMAPDGSEVVLAGLYNSPNPLPYGWATAVDRPMVGPWSVKVLADPAAVAHRIHVEWSEEGLGPEPTSQQQSASEASC